ncbi:peroxiredoxin [Kamptonema animale CS-326]|jgi:peroxiredoxin Q/BCP|uniref:peroxiredoxin n=1 Tax=Kamptonema animale TaxID=92934 RepID=UPI00232AD60A|nr:peroxiredoxin [Kamptonema animale]MDB9513650.1 peroxiredoxin [Kamptonema animale CS-326]
MTSRRNFLSIFFAICLVLLSLNFVPPALALGGKLPAVNQPAPEFTLPTNSGKGKVSLSDYRGKWLVVYFYPQDFTSGCTLEARRFQQDLPKYRGKNTEILGISVDDIKSHAEFCDSEGLRFPLLADTDGKVSKAYGSWMSFISARHSFIIDPDGILRETFVKVNPAIHSQEVLARLDELQSNG